MHRTLRNEITHEQGKYVVLWRNIGGGWKLDTDISLQRPVRKVTSLPLRSAALSRSAFRRTQRVTW